MSKIVFVVLATLLLNVVDCARAQSKPNIPKIGYQTFAAPGDEAFEAFRAGMHDLGYIEGKNVMYEQRHADFKIERLPVLAAELVELKVAVIVTGFTHVAVAAKRATQTIPIVMASGTDPVGAGLVASLAEPGGNVTGLTSVSGKVGQKRLELLKEINPKITTLAVLTNYLGPYAATPGDGAALR